ncbi:MAG: N-formylglutamate amidohydrolase [Candidatus Nanopelagicaceae bacterium]|nr:N-formylglutamate amidohydrolase [Candidatus Nanopelagicaceae bacterium]
MLLQNFEIITGDPNSKVILHVPHSATFIPEEIRVDILLSDQELKAELDEMTDTFTEAIALKAAELSGSKPWLFINNFSRLVIDPERFPDDREAMNAVGMGAVYQKTSIGTQLRNPNPTLENHLLDTYFHPYSKSLSDLVAQRFAVLGEVTLVDVHSYRVNQHPNAINHGQVRPPICIGADSFHTPEWLVEAAQSAFSIIGENCINQPFAGTYVPLSFYEKEPKITSVMMETRADTFLTDDLAAHDGFETVAKALSQLVELIQLR